ncbi:hypothetical protein [Candidatus Chlamydia corallus]|uniref:hypothetical protein n=1 Tax=Candidatus Chlamydia corallus TaxID=2038470 RepID=UPI000C2FA8D1|nr:hypothetical protein [Candidatus Chlamydia corallus]
MSLESSFNSGISNPLKSSYISLLEKGDATQNLCGVLGLFFLILHLIFVSVALACACLVLSPGLYLGFIISGVLFGIIGVAFLAAFKSPEIVQSRLDKDKKLPFSLRVTLQNELLNRFEKGQKVSSDFFKVLFEDHNPTLSDLYQVAFFCGGAPYGDFPQDSEALNIYKALCSKDRNALASLVTEGLDLEEMLSKESPLYWFSNLRDVAYRKHALSLSEFLGLGHPTFLGFVHKDHLPILAFLEFKDYTALLDLREECKNFSCWKSMGKVQTLLNRAYSAFIGQGGKLSLKQKEAFAFWLYESFSVVALCNETKELLSYLGTIRASSLKELSKRGGVEALVESISSEEGEDYDLTLYKTWADYSKPCKFLEIFSFL